MSKLEKLDGALFEPVASDEASRLTGGKLTAFGRCNVNGAIETDYNEDWWAV